MNHSYLSAIKNKQAGFTLFELMIAIAVIAILTAIALPAYQGYIQKAAVTDMLQTMTPYKTAVEICSLEQGNLSNCNNGSNGVPVTKSTNYVTSTTVSAGVITLVGQNALSGLTVTLTPTVNATHGNLDWARTCVTSPTNNSLTEACEDVFRF
ncbi:prepilin peptidase-dependent pilin [Orbaceae bacterium ac157xtp]